MDPEQENLQGLISDFKSQTKSLNWGIKRKPRDIRRDGSWQIKMSLERKIYKSGVYMFVDFMFCRVLLSLHAHKAFTHKSMIY